MCHKLSCVQLRLHRLPARSGTVLRPVWTVTYQPCPECTHCLAKHATLVAALSGTLLRAAVLTTPFGWLHWLHRLPSAPVSNLYGVLADQRGVALQLWHLHSRGHRHRQCSCQQRSAASALFSACMGRCSAHVASPRASCARHVRRCTKSPWTSLSCRPVR